MRRYLSVHRDQVEEVFATLSHFDGVAFARRASAPALFSVALMDPVCPPSTVYAAYNEISAPKEIVTWPFGVHSPPRGHAERQLRHLRERLGSGT